MPATKAMELLVKTRPASTREEYNRNWLQFLEARRQALLPYLKDFTFQRLDEFECMSRSGITRVSIGLNVTVRSGEARLGTETQGIFGIQPDRNIEKSADGSWGTKKLWGLTRKGEWVVVKIRYDIKPTPHCRSGEWATMVDIRRVELSEMVAETGESPAEIWRQLSRPVAGWERRHRSLCKRAKKLKSDFALERELALLTGHS